MKKTVIDHRGYRGELDEAGRPAIMAGFALQPLMPNVDAARELQAYAEYVTLMALAATDAVGGTWEEGITGIHYAGRAHRRRHGELVKAGVEKARQRGTRIGRARVTYYPGFARRFARVVERMESDGLTLSQAAKELKIGLTTLRRLLRPDPD